MEVIEMLSQNGTTLLMTADNYKFYFHHQNKDGTAIYRCVKNNSPCKLARKYSGTNQLLTDTITAQMNILIDKSYQII